MKSILRLLIAGIFAAALPASWAQAPAGKTEVLWLGQSAFRISTPGGKVIVTDPWLKLNPLTPPEYKNLEALGKVDVILVTHGHFDHFANAPALALLNQVPMHAPGDMSVLVPSAPRVTAIERLDQPGVTVGVSRGSSSERVLAGRLKQAKLRSFPTLDAARSALQAREIDAFATNKGILFELAERVPGARVLEGGWGSEHLAPAIPKGRAGGMPYLRTFTEEVRRNGELDRAIIRAGLRGTVPPAQ